MSSHGFLFSPNYRAKGRPRDFGVALIWIPEEILESPKLLVQIVVRLQAAIQCFSLLFNSKHVYGLIGILVVVDLHFFLVFILAEIGRIQLALVFYPEGG